LGDELAVHADFGLELEQVAGQAAGQFGGLDRAAVGVGLGQIAVDEVEVGLAGGDEAQGEFLAGEAGGGLAEAGEFAAGGTVAGLFAPGSAVGWVLREHARKSRRWRDGDCGWRFAFEI